MGVHSFTTDLLGIVHSESTVDESPTSSKPENFHLHPLRCVFCFTPTARAPAPRVLRAPGLAPIDRETLTETEARKLWIASPRCGVRRSIEPV